MNSKKFDNSEEKTTIVAMEAELKPFLDIYDFEKRIIENLKFRVKNANGKKIVFVQSYSGKVNSAIATTLMIREFDPDWVIVAGTSGGVNESLGIGDIAISRDRVSVRPWYENRGGSRNMENTHKL